MEATRDPRLATTLLIYDEVQRALDRQFEQIQLLNGRAQQLLGFSAIVVGVMIGLRPPTHGWVSTLLFAIAFLFLMLVVFCGYQAWSIRGWRHDPQPRKLWERYRLWPDAWLRQQLILNWIASQDANQESIDAKIQYIRITQILLGVEVMYLVGLAIARPYLP